MVRTFVAAKFGVQIKIFAFLHWILKTMFRSNTKITLNNYNFVVCFHKCWIQCMNEHNCALRKLVPLFCFCNHCMHKCLSLIYCQPCMLFIHFIDTLCKFSLLILLNWLMKKKLHNFIRSTYLMQIFLFSNSIMDYFAKLIIRMNDNNEMRKRYDNTR